MHLSSISRSTAMLGALFLASCASKKISPTATGSLQLQRPDILELHEAFKTTRGEKTVALVSKGEVKCADRLCQMPVRGEAQVFTEGKPSGTTTVPGTFVFDADSMRHLLDLIDEARDFGKKKSDKGTQGEVVCDRKGCELTFLFPSGGEARSADLVTPFEERPRKPGSEMGPEVSP